VRRFGIGSRVALALVATALVPLVAFGTWSLIALERDTRDAFLADAVAMATRNADDVAQAIAADAALMKPLAEALRDTPDNLETEARTLGIFAARFHEVRELTILDDASGIVATTAGVKPRATIPTGNTTVGDVIVGPVEPGPLAPSVQLGLRLADAQPVRWLVAEVTLDEVSRIIRRGAGTSGRVLLFSADGTLIAGGGAEGRSNGQPGDHPLRGRAASTTQTYKNARGEEVLGSVAQVAGLNWSLVVEQPLSSTVAATDRLRRQLAIFMLATLAVVLAVSAYLGRRFAAPLVSFEEATRALAGGDFRARVETTGPDEFGRVAASFNAMADRLMKLQEDIKSQERQVMFGRIVAGLFHDISHPVQNIANNARLLLRDDLDAETRSSVQVTIDRELDTLRRFLDDVLNVARPRPLERFPVDVSATLKEVVEAMRAEADRSGIAIAGHYTADATFIDGDRFALGRVYRNLLKNAVQATPRGGVISVITAHVGRLVEIQVTDTGAGIPPDRLAAIFDDFVTTRRLGLGLGLATARRIVEQLGGTIAVTSEVGRGSTFTVRFPATSAQLAETLS
jgi:signal transduction histidine kinase